ncbi:ribosome biogenesis GTPase Der [Mesotoga sp. UBA6090]|uniref:ribosome biogenesis GTPase Der n=1 Tax=Mesotoga sp. UBA6090 TaxID=1946860 RepID=UPI0025EFCB0C|nr:ribosome biogenesis GTPase Der [Mesotoga sp. UBA6090]
MATVLIIGRPNVGKSTLFNRLVGGRRAIVDDIPGVTRDFTVGRVDWQQRTFQLVDTCGLFENPENIVEEKMKEVTLELLSEGDLILFVVDGRNGLTSADLELADYLRKQRLQIVFVANKVENLDSFYSSVGNEIFSLGFGDPIKVSSAHGLNIDILLDKIFDRLVALGHSVETEEIDESALKISIVGKPNAGKSSIFNWIVGSPRSLVTEVSGTTRDTVDETVVIDDIPITFIDTAGIRKKSKVKVMNVEYYSVMRAIDALERSDIIIMVIDSADGIGNQDQRIAGLAEKNGKATIAVFNKCDLVDGRRKKALSRTFKQDLYFIDYSPVVFASTLTGEGMDELLDNIMLVTKKIDLRIPTGLLNTLLQRYSEGTPAPGKGKKRGKIYYGAQIASRPPIIMLNVNDPALFTEPYLRGIRNSIRLNFDPFDGTPIFLKLRRKR